MININNLTTEDLKQCILDAREELISIQIRKTKNISYSDDEELKTGIEIWLENARSELLKRI